MAKQLEAGMLGITITKPNDMRAAPTVSVSLEIENVGRADIELTAAEFTHLLGASMMRVPVRWRYEP